MKLLLLLALAFSAALALADIKTETVAYKHGDVELEGFLAYDDAVKGKRAAVLVVHDWMGNGPFSHKKAEELAKLGYVAFAVDIYGKGVRPKDRAEASQQAGKYKNDRPLLRARVNAGLDVLLKNEMVDAQRIGAIGFCFGGTTVLELARSGSPVAGVVSFHGGLSSPTPDDAQKIKGKVLVLHGADDPFVPPEEVAAFQKEMRDAKVDWQMVSYGNSVHSFTNPNAGNDNSKGAAYNEKADKRSWEDMKDFFTEAFK